MFFSFFKDIFVKIKRELKWKEHKKVEKYFWTTSDGKIEIFLEDKRYEDKK